METYKTVKESLNSNRVVKELNAAVLTATFPNQKGTYEADIYTNGQSKEIVYKGSCAPINSEHVGSCYVVFETYAEIKNQDAPSGEYFFAFSDRQFAEGKSKMPEGKKIYSAGGGMYGTEKGIVEFRSFYDKQTDRIKAECTPQEIYDHEYSNHECGYVCDDEEAIKFTLLYFDKDKVGEVKRKHGHVSIESID